jgi:hypothetical protein
MARQSLEELPSTVEVDESLIGGLEKISTNTGSGSKSMGKCGH